MSHWKRSFPGKFLQSAELDTPIVATISRIRNVNVGGEGSGELKPVADFVENIKSVVLNQSRCEAIAAIAGSEDMDDWPDTRVLLQRGTTRYQGKKVSCIEIAAPPHTRSAASTPAAPSHDPVDEPGDNVDVPF